MVRDMSHFLLVFDRAQGRLLREDTFEDSHAALVERFRAERLHRGGTDIEVVVLSAESKQALRRTHARYFETVSSMATVGCAADRKATWTTTAACGR